MDPNEDGWWALDFAGYLLSRSAHLGDLSPSALSVSSICDWIRRTELPWAPGSTDLSACPWSIIDASADEAALFDSVLEMANGEFHRLRELEKIQRERSTPVDLIARRRMPETTLRSYDNKSMDLGVHSGEIADAHVHQGATLPIEVTLHWVSNRLVNFTDDRKEIRRLQSVGETSTFDPLPLLFVLRAIREDHPEWKRALNLARQAAFNPRKGTEWSELEACLQFDRIDDAVPTSVGILRMKREARKDWEAPRRIALLKVEAVLYGAIVQQAPGLDVFVDLFEDFSSLRRGRMPKDVYFEKAIEAHRDRAPDLRALELRLGEPIFAENPPGVGKLAADFRDALSGYLLYAKGRDRPPRVTFPVSFVKTRPNGYPQPQNWRFNPEVVYGLTESLIDLFGECPGLAPFVDGVDVCGNEVDAPNWLFAPAYERLGEWAKQKTLPMTFRFHAGEWQSTPLHGLRRIAEFADFELPPMTRKRLGHGLALSSQDWTRLGGQELDELLDDLVWLNRRLRQAKGPLDLIRSAERELFELARHVYPKLDFQPTLANLELAFDLRVDPIALKRIGFMNQGMRLGFKDGLPTPGGRHIDQLMVAHMGTRAEPISTVAEYIGAAGSRGHEQLRLLLSDAYEILVGEVVEDLRWRSIVVEACPTSNVIVGGVRGFGRHPLREMIDRGLLTVLGSDDPSLFHVYVAEEAGSVREAIGIPERLVDRSQKLSIDLVAPTLDTHEVLVSLESTLKQLEQIAAVTP